MWKKLFLILLILFLGGYAAFMGLYFYTSEPSFCLKCHEIKDYVTAWQNSPHKEVKCFFCHEPRGFLGKIHSKSRGLNYVYQQWTNNYTIPTSAIIPESNCIACHLGDNKYYPNAVRLSNEITNHFELIKQDESCLKCHRDAGHATDINITSSLQKAQKNR